MNPTRSQKRWRLQSFKVQVSGHGAPKVGAKAAARDDDIDSKIVGPLDKADEVRVRLQPVGNDDVVDTFGMAATHW